MYFRQFQNLSEETRSRAALDFIELCFLTIVSYKSKQLLIHGWIIFLFSEIITISILHYFVWTLKRLNLNHLKFDIKFCEIEEDVKRHALSYRTNIRVGNTEKSAFFDQAYGTQKAILTNQIWAQRTAMWRPNSQCAKDSLWVIEQYISEKLSYTTCAYRNQTISELRYKFGSVYIYT